MAFCVDHTRAYQDRTMPPEGKYETVIESFRESVTSKGARFLDLNLTIRQDVNQTGRGKTMHYLIWRKKVPGPLDPEGYPMGAVQNLSKSAGLVSGLRFGNLQEWMACLPGLPILATVRNEEYNGSKKARVAFVDPPKAFHEKGTEGLGSEDLPY